MLRDRLLKGLLGVSAVAALFGVLAAQAQSTGTAGTAGQSTTGQSTSGQSTTGQGGAASPSGSTAGQAGTYGQSGTSGTRGQTGSTAGQTGTTGQTGASGTSGSTTSGATATTTTATTATTATLSKGDEKIVMDMARANMAEIEAGKLAQSKSQNEQVKNFAQQMIDDHTKALNDVQALAQSKGVTLPTEPDAKHKAMADKLGAMSGEAFDKAYMRQAGVSDHKKVHSMLQHDQSRAKDPDVRALAAKMLPTVEQHLNAAKQMPAAKGVGKDSKSTASGDAADKVTTGSKRNQ